MYFVLVQSGAAVVEPPLVAGPLVFNAAIADSIADLVGAFFSFASRSSSAGTASESPSLARPLAAAWRTVGWGSSSAYSSGLRALKSPLVPSFRQASTRKRKSSAVFRIFSCAATSVPAVRAGTAIRRIAPAASSA